MITNTVNTVTFLDIRCRVHFGHYRNGRLAILLRRLKDDMPVATATANVPAMPLEDDQVLIKDYAENQGILAALEAAGIVCTTHVCCRLGYVRLEVCRLLIDRPTVH